jgi:serine/threonine protein phosphatase PrpC
MPFRSTSDAICFRCSEKIEDLGDTSFFRQLVRTMFGLWSSREAKLPLRIAGAMRSHVGLVREGNEDSVAYILPADGDPMARRGALALVADGMGGHAAGEVASRLAAETVCSLFYQLKSPIPQTLSECLAAANSAVRSCAEANPDFAGMGTTCTIMAFSGDRAFLGHVGDSRAYLLRGAKVLQISEDQSLVAMLVREGRLTADQARTHPDRNVIISALGIAPEVDAQIWRDGMKLKEGDVIILCSDGLSDLVDENGLAEIAGGRPPAEACDALIEAALAGGGHDNVSVGVFAVMGAGPATPIIDTTREMEMAAPADATS